MVLSITITPTRTSRRHSQPVFNMRIEEGDMQAEALHDGIHSKNTNGDDATTRPASFWYETESWKSQNTEGVWNAHHLHRLYEDEAVRRATSHVQNLLAGRVES